ncbi:hypothetical protein K505DRAFT_344556 [Melanomma pulvis-pyrius CBS 109.77]|uniref:Uncharacterized protein n=1 Tax=Melanomma pulvis-pyrius CBS 109.77 TaxID=1314802 RepID=A0A6A6WNA4_9PLEO|nr:hypothetical protein K505DRAFT_344556 [Melanomma pulvis-pyrius CBS 109.77]
MNPLNIYADVTAKRETQTYTRTRNQTRSYRNNASPLREAPDSFLQFTPIPEDLVQPRTRNAPKPPIHLDPHTVYPNKEAQRRSTSRDQSPVDQRVERKPVPSPQRKSISMTPEAVSSNQFIDRHERERQKDFKAAEVEMKELSSRILAQQKKDEESKFARSGKVPKGPKLPPWEKEDHSSNMAREEVGRAVKVKRREKVMRSRMATKDTFSTTNAGVQTRSEGAVSTTLGSEVTLHARNTKEEQRKMALQSSSNKDLVDQVTIEAPRFVDRHTRERREAQGQGEASGGSNVNVNINSNVGPPVQYTYPNINANGRGARRERCEDGCCAVM